MVLIKNEIDCEINNLSRQHVGAVVRFCFGLAVTLFSTYEGSRRCETHAGVVVSRSFVLHSLWEVCRRKAKTYTHSRLSVNEIDSNKERLTLDYSCERERKEKTCFVLLSYCWGSARRRVSAVDFSDTRVLHSFASAFHFIRLPSKRDLFVWVCVPVSVCANHQQDDLQDDLEL